MKSAEKDATLGSGKEETRRPGRQQAAADLQRTEIQAHDCRRWYRLLDGLAALRRLSQARWRRRGVRLASASVRASAPGAGSRRACPPTALPATLFRVGTAASLLLPTATCLRGSPLLPSITCPPVGPRAATRTDPQRLKHNKHCRQPDRHSRRTAYQTIHE